MVSNEEILVEENDTKLNPPHFSCRTLLDANTQGEASAAIAPKSVKLVYYVALATMVLAIGWLVAQFVLTKEKKLLYYLAAAILLGAYLIYKECTAPKRLLRRWEERMIRTLGSASVYLTAEFYDFSIAQSVQDSDEVAVDSYSDLHRLVETEHLFLLQKFGNHWYILDKQGFTGCTAEEFRTFITSKIGGE